MWDICMLKSENEAWIFLMIIIKKFLHNMLRLVVGHLLLPTTLTIFTHINHVHIAQILIIVLVIVHPGDNVPIFHMSKCTQISLDRGKLKSREILLPNTMNCTIPSIRSSITNLLLLHHTIIWHKNYNWKTQSKHIHKR
jgi:hypothetical protein